VTLRRIVVAPDKFKGSLSAVEAARAIERGLRAGAPSIEEVRIIPMADGGEGTVEAFLAGGAQAIVRTVRGPLGDPVEATFALDGATAIIEMSSASGLSLIPQTQRDVLRATTFGTGELVRAALDAGATRLVVGIGGSATNDGGAGLLQALGAHLVGASGSELSPGGAALADLARIDLHAFDPRVHSVRFEIAADVDNPLCGPSGASVIFGPQKGATPEDVRRLDAALAHFADVAARTLGVDRRNDPGAGAAGGLGFALLAFTGATLRRGVEIVARLRGLPQALAGVDAVFTGEGSIDGQTLAGKTVAGVARLAKAACVRTIVAFGGRVDPAAAQALEKLGVTSVAIAERDVPLADSMRNAATLLERAAKRTMESILASGAR
jgi:glycerate kinase